MESVRLRVPVAAALIAAWVAAAPPASARSDVAALRPGPGAADRVIVLKGERKLILMRNGRVFRVYSVALGRYAGDGHKVRAGDARTPEGSYTLDYRLHDSKFYKAIHISYPNARDLERAEALGVEPGGSIMIHGLPRRWTARRLNHPYLDWTQGCIAVTNREIDEIWAAVRDGTPIDILP